MSRCRDRRCCWPRADFQDYVSLHLSRSRRNAFYVLAAERNGAVSLKICKERFLPPSSSACSKIILKFSFFVRNLLHKMSILKSRVLLAIQSVRNLPSERQLLPAGSFDKEPFPHTHIPQQNLLILVPYTSLYIFEKTYF